MKEFEWLAKLQYQHGYSLSSGLVNPSFVGLGDDCAVIPMDKQQAYLISTDLLIEEVHFSLKWSNLSEVLWKSLAANVSDIAAMAGKSRFVFLSIAVPETIRNALFQTFLCDLKQLLIMFDLVLLGGDTSISKSGLFISVTVIGEQHQNQILYRHGARQNDYIYITGNLGDSSMGLHCLKQGHWFNCSKKHQDYFRHAHLKPMSRAKEMFWLNQQIHIHSAIDVSDGFSGDMQHLLSASKVGAKLIWNNFPLSQPFKHLAGDCLSDLNSIYSQFVLHGGEDYEVIFTCPHKISQSKLQQFQNKFECRLSHIGHISKDKGCSLIVNGQNTSLLANSYEHFSA